jgi:adenosylhomocysteine nucleosidase
MSDPLQIDDPCVLFALRRESAPFLRVFPIQQRFPGAPCWVRFCGPPWLTVLAVEMGVGPKRCQQALDWLLSEPELGNLPYRPKVILSAGFCGGLDERFRVGDVILATEVVDGQGLVWPATWPTDLRGGEWRPPLHRSRLLTMPRLIGDVTEKKELATRLQAGVVDMESAVIADACKKKGIPFGCLRVVSDDAHTPLSPKLVSVLSGGRASAVKLAAIVATSPGIVAQLWRLGRDTKVAARQLGLALGEVLTLTLPWTEE